MLLYVAIGLVAGVLAGLFGIGGGVVIVAALTIVAKLPIKQAVGTSLGVLALPVVLLGAITHWRAGNLNIKIALFVALGLIFGAWAGARLTQTMTPMVLQRLFAVFLLVMAVHMWVKA